MSKLIPLSKGLHAIVDDEDFEWLSQWKWSAMGGKKGWTHYASGSQGMMHRLILGLKPHHKRIADHINGNGLDNRRCNLRRVTNGQNQRNKGPNKNNTLGIKGVYWHLQKKRFQVQVMHNWKAIYIGRYLTLEKAIKARNQAYKRYHGKYARFGNDMARTIPGSTVPEMQVQVVPTSGASCELS